MGILLKALGWFIKWFWLLLIANPIATYLAKALSDAGVLTTSETKLICIACISLVFYIFEIIWIVHMLHRKKKKHTVNTVNTQPQGNPNYYYAPPCYPAYAAQGGYPYAPLAAPCSQTTQQNVQPDDTIECEAIKSYIKRKETIKTMVNVLSQLDEYKGLDEDAVLNKFLEENKNG